MLAIERPPMMRLSRLSDYGIVLMALLAGRAGAEDGTTPSNAREVAAEAHLPLPVVSKVLKSLARRGLLVSHRGSKGGYSLARPAEQITAAEMIAALEGPIGLTECSAHPGHCVQEASCHVREPWQRINARLRRALAEVTLADLVPQRPPDAGTIPLHGLAPAPLAAPGLAADDRHR
jgi:FeS assembly SUF system regulator